MTLFSLEKFMENFSSKIIFNLYLYDEPSTGSAEIELRIDIAETTLYQYAKKLFNQKISLKTRVKIMNSIVRRKKRNTIQYYISNFALV